MREFKIQKNEAGQRFDKYLKKLLVNAPSSFVYKMLRKKNIVLNDKKADGTEKINIGDSVKIYFSDETFLKFSESSEQTRKTEQLPQIDLSNLPFQVLYETDDVLIINKPSGMLSQKAVDTDISANEYILAYLLKSGALKKEELNTFRPSVCNRLDRNTSGILVAGKTLKGSQEMSEQLKTRAVQKFYFCIVNGLPPKQQHIKGYLCKDTKKNTVTVKDSADTADDKYIETEYRVVKSYENAALLEVHLITGRSHQIRAHLASVGHFILGDFKYGDKKINQRWKESCGLNTQLLHAGKIRLADGEEIEAPLPKEFQKVLRILEK